MAFKRHLPRGFIYVWKIEDNYSFEMGNPTDIIYNLETKIIYYYFHNKGKNRSLCPYYGPNGKKCTIKCGQIVEVG